MNNTNEATVTRQPHVLVMHQGPQTISHAHLLSQYSQRLARRLPMQTEKYKLVSNSLNTNEDQSSPDVTDGRESKCCPACKADVYTSRNLIHGPSEEVYNQYARSNSYPTGSDTFKEEFEAAKINLDRLTATIALLEAERARLKGIVEKYSAIFTSAARYVPRGFAEHIPIVYAMGIRTGLPVLEKLGAIDISSLDIRRSRHSGPIARPQNPANLLSDLASGSADISLTESSVNRDDLL
ncbi:hypothetical protein Moror_11635 [Moniliophthora roreri MCA 2997]|uniref:Uncharacterized protein n=1 Tax=Moniliophthora roreri (strain MCA 2997) TaxID=1381753 RepID=V2X4N6_MONRO|nr:hypothetical protein Moror_11635 [Moniliophthora roreri MCA 2997]